MPLVLIVLSVLGQVGSNAGIVGMTKEHLGLALALNVPVFVVVTKIDMCPANILQGKCRRQQSVAQSPTVAPWWSAAWDLLLPCTVRRPWPECPPAQRLLLPPCLALGLSTAWSYLLLIVPSSYKCRIPEGPNLASLFRWF